MPVESRDSDPEIAARLRQWEERLLDDTSPAATKVSKPPVDVGVSVVVMASDADATEVELRPEQREAARRATEVLKRHGARNGFSLKDKLAMLLVAAGFGAAGYFGLSHVAGPVGDIGQVLCYGTGGLLALGGLFSDLRRQRKNAGTAGGSVSYPSDVLEALLALADLTPAERRYGDLLVLLAREKSPLDGVARQEMLAQVNGLLEDYRMLGRHCEAVLELLDEAQEAALRAEYARLMAEAGAAEDPVVRETKRQSAALIESRVADAREVQRAAERMQAQQEAIYETLGTLHSRLTRLHLAPAGLHGGNADSLRETLEQVSGQTRAVEQAVQEVLSVRAGS